MPPSRNEIKLHAIAVTEEWRGGASESGEAKSFWGGLFHGAFRSPPRRQPPWLPLQ